MEIRSRASSGTLHLTMLQISTTLDPPQHKTRAGPRPAFSVVPVVTDFDDLTLEMPMLESPEAPATIDLPPAGEASGEPVVELVSPSPLGLPPLGAVWIPAANNESAIPLGTSATRVVQPVALPAATPTAETIVGIGSVLRNRYQLDRQIGTGGFSLIFAATDLHRLSAGSPAPFVAIKMLKPELRSTPEAISRLKREFARLEALSHPNIGHAYDLDHDGEVWFLVLELLDGQPVSTLLSRQPQRPIARTDALQIIVASGEALDFAHQHGVLHCDFKPGNILINQSDEVRVIDFGAGFDQYSRPVSASADARDDRRQATPAYASPEALAGELPDVRDDIYSFAAVAYELLTGTRYLAAVSPASGGIPQRQPDRPQGLGLNQWRLLSQALSPTRAGRPASLRILVDAFKARNLLTREWLVVCGCALIVGLSLLRPGAPDIADPALLPAVKPISIQQMHGPLPLVLPLSSRSTLYPPAATADSEALARTAEPSRPVPAPTRTSAAAEMTLISLDQPNLRISRPTAMAAMIVQRIKGPQRRARVLWRTVPGTALPGVDYVPVAQGVVQFADNQNLSSLYVPLLDQGDVTIERTFFIEITSGTPQVDVGPVTRVAVTIGG